MTRSRNCPTLFTAIALASCIVSLPAAALVSQGTLPSMFERQGLPQWPDNPWIGPLDQGLPVMALRPIGLLEPLLGSISESELKCGVVLNEGKAFDLDIGGSELLAARLREA